jgi:hypothetical protein
MSMEDDISIDKRDPDLVVITVDGLRKRLDSESQNTKQHMEQFLLPKSASLKALWAKIECAITLFFSLNRSWSASLTNLSDGL